MLTIHCTTGVIYLGVSLPQHSTWDLLSLGWPLLDFMLGKTEALGGGGGGDAARVTIAACFKGLTPRDLTSYKRPASHYPGSSIPFLTLRPSWAAYSIQRLGKA